MRLTVIFRPCTMWREQSANRKARRWKDWFGTTEVLSWTLIRDVKKPVLIQSSPTYALRNCPLHWFLRNGCSKLFGRIPRCIYAMGLLYICRTRGLYTANRTGNRLPGTHGIRRMGKRNVCVHEIHNDGFRSRAIPLLPAHGMRKQWCGTGHWQRDPTVHAPHGGHSAWNCCTRTPKPHSCMEHTRRTDLNGQRNIMMGCPQAWTSWNGTTTFCSLQSQSYRPDNGCDKKSEQLSPYQGPRKLKCYGIHRMSVNQLCLRMMWDNMTSVCNM